MISALIGIVLFLFILWFVFLLAETGTLLWFLFFLILGLFSAGYCLLQ